MNSIDNVWNVMKKEIGSQIPCLKEEMRSVIWCSIEHPGRTLQFNAKNNCRSYLTYEAKGVATNTDFYGVGVQLCCCVFIGLH